MEVAKYLVFTVALSCFLISVGAIGLDSSLLAAMDDYALTMERERADVDFTKVINVSEPLEKRITALKSFGKSERGESGRKGGAAEVRVSSSGGRHLGMSFGKKRKVPILRSFGRFAGIRPHGREVTRFEDLELVEEMPTYGRKIKPKIDFKALLRNLEKGAKKTTKAKIPLNKNLQAMNQIQNGMLEAEAMIEGIDVAIIQEQIKKACDARQYIIARQLLGHNIYSIRKDTDSKRLRREVTSTKTILNDIKRKIGQTRYNELMAFDGGVTLAFALDTTGSMHDDIDAAKSIVFGIVTHDRAFSVDYILSPFNDPVSDPKHGPVTYMDKIEKYKFLDLVTQISEAGGGDCDELAIDGIMNIFASSTQYRSPIYVLTDAGAKDATPENIEALKEMILTFKTPINFFLSNAGCLTEESINVYKSLARFSGGQILYFSNKKQIASTTKFIQDGLIGGSTIPVIPRLIGGSTRPVIPRLIGGSTRPVLPRLIGGFTGPVIPRMIRSSTRRAMPSLPRSIYRARLRWKRSVDFQYSIVVDDSVDVLSTSVMDRSNVNVQLFSPDGKLQRTGKISTGKGALYMVNKPTPGVWKIKCPSCSLKSYVSSSTISLENIDFEYNFLVKVKVGSKSRVISSNFPIKGIEATVVITVPAHNKTQPSSFKLKVVSDTFATLHAASLKQYGRVPGRYKGSFPTPSSDFSLVLEGKTKQGKAFKRLGNGIIKPKSAMVHVLSAPKGFAVKTGSKSPTILKFALHCFSGNELFDVKVNKQKRFTVKKPRALRCTPKHMTLFTLSFRAASAAKKGETRNVVVSLYNKKSGTKTSKHVQLLLV